MCMHMWGCATQKTRDCLCPFLVSGGYFFHIWANEEREPATLRQDLNLGLSISNTPLFQLLGPVLAPNCMCQLSSQVWPFATLWTIARQAPLSMEFSRQENWSGFSFPSAGDLPNAGIKPGSPALQAGSLPSEPSGKPFSST